MKKLRNKITGEINEFMVHKRIEDGEDGNRVYAPFDGNIDEWEDYEDSPYVIDMWEDNCICDAKFGVELEGIERAKECGLYFKTKEEAEKAVEKLKAWKRLKDKGFEFNGFELIEGKIRFVIDLRELEESDLYKDLILLFGKE